MTFAQCETVERDVLEAGMAPVRARPVAKFLAARSHHQPVMVTDGIIVVQRHDDPALWQGSPDDMRKLRAEQEQMVDMDDLRPEVAQQLRNIRNDSIEVDLAHEEAVEMSGPQQQFVPCGPDALKAGARPRLAVDLVRGSEKERFAAGTLVGAEQVVGEDLRASRVEGRMVMSRNEHAHAHAPPPRRSATKMS